MPWITEQRTRLEGYRAADPKILREIYRIYSKPLATSLARGFVFSDRGRSIGFAGYARPFELDDIVQDAFLRAFRESARQSYDGVRPFAGFLYSIAKNLVIDRYRKSVRESKIFTEIDFQEHPPPDEDCLTPEAEAMDRQFAAMYQSFVDTLSPTDQKLLRIRFEDGASRREVEEQTQLTQRKIRTREKFIRKALAKFMKQKGYTHNQWLKLADLVCLCLGGGS